MRYQSEKNITIDKIAELCGVSKTTISRFLNGKYENMSFETKARISEVIEKNNFRPNRSAQRLKAGYSMLVGCVIADISSPFSALLLKGITDVFEEHGYQVMFADSHNSIERERSIIEGFLENRVDGLIVNTCGGNDDFILELKKRGVNLVLADRELPDREGIDTVTSSNRESAAACTEFLFDQGYDKVAFFTEKMGAVSPRILRYEGYLDALKNHFQEAEPEVYELSEDGKADCARSISEYINKYPGKRLAILSSNGTGVLQILLALNELKLKPGYELGLYTFDDWDWLGIASTGISAVELFSKEIGEQSAALLLRRITKNDSDDASPAKIIVPCKHIVRDSTPCKP